MSRSKATQCSSHAGLQERPGKGNQTRHSQSRTSGGGGVSCVCTCMCVVYQAYFSHDADLRRLWVCFLHWRSAACLFCSVKPNCRHQVLQPWSCIHAKGVLTGMNLSGIGTLLGRCFQGGFLVLFPAEHMLFAAPLFAE